MSEVSIRPLITTDIPNIVNYWCESTAENLLRIGADHSKLSSPLEFSQTLQTICQTPAAEAKMFYMVWLIDNQPVGYSALKDIEHNAIAGMHLHMWSTTHRGKGYGATLFCMSAVEFYKLFNLKIILCEPRALNPMPNKMLTRVGFKKWKTYVSTSSDVAQTCELNSYIIDLERAKNFLSFCSPDTPVF